MLLLLEPLLLVVVLTLIFAPSTSVGLRSSLRPRYSEGGGAGWRSALLAPPCGWCACCPPPLPPAPPSLLLSRLRSNASSRAEEETDIRSAVPLPPSLFLSKGSRLLCFADTVAAAAVSASLEEGAPEAVIKLALVTPMIDVDVWKSTLPPDAFVPPPDVP